MSASLALRPLASWDPFVLRLDRDLLVLFALRLLQRHARQVEALALNGEGDRLLVEVTFRVAGVAAPARLAIEEIRMKGGILGFRLQQLRGPLGLGVPRVLVGILAKRLPLPVEFHRDSGVVVVDLRERLPLGLELEVREVRVAGVCLEVVLGPGRLTFPVPTEVEDLVAPEPPAGV